MKENNLNLVGVGAMLLLLVSLPLDWMSLQSAQMQFSGGFQGFGDLMSSAMGGMTVQVTGLNGHITFLAKTPIWLIVFVGIMGVLLSFLNRMGLTTLHKYVPLVPLSLSAVYVVVAFIIAVGSATATVGIGIIVASIGLVGGFLYALSNPSIAAKSS